MIINISRFLDDESADSQISETRWNTISVFFALAFASCFVAACSTPNVSDGEARFVMDISIMTMAIAAPILLTSAP